MGARQSPPAPVVIRPAAAETSQEKKHEMATTKQTSPTAKASRSLPFLTAALLMCVASHSWFSYEQAVCTINKVSRIFDTMHPCPGLSYCWWTFTVRGN